jgi:hypothetical protein
MFNGEHPLSIADFIQSHEIDDNASIVICLRSEFVLRFKDTIFASMEK